MNKNLPLQAHSVATITLRSHYSVFYGPKHTCIQRIAINRGVPPLCAQKRLGLVQLPMTIQKKIMLEDHPYSSLLAAAWAAVLLKEAHQ